MLVSSPALAHALQKVTTIAQVTLLVPQPLQPGSSNGNDAAAGAPPPLAAAEEAPLCVINTHLFFHPFAPHIRSLHVAAIQEEAAGWLADWAALEPSLAGAPPPTVLFCGDLNSDLNDGVPGVVEMLQTGKLSAEHWDWRMGAAFSWGKGEEEYGEGGASAAAQAAVAETEAQAAEAAASSSQAAAAAAAGEDAGAGVLGVDVVAPFALRSADDLLTPWTNYTSGYRGLLDYVWYQPQRLAVARQLPMPAEQLLASFIPSPAFPSDHLAVMYDFVFRPAAGAAAAGATAAVPAAAGEPQPHDPSTFMLLPALSEHVADAVAALARSEVIGLPTDTLYGLAASATSAAALQRLGTLKGRQQQQPLAVALARVADVSSYCHTEGLPPGLLESLLPGPVTVLLPRRQDAPLDPALNPGEHEGGREGEEGNSACCAVCNAPGP